MKRGSELFSLFLGILFVSLLFGLAGAGELDDASISVEEHIRNAGAASIINRPPVLGHNGDRAVIFALDTYPFQVEVRRVFALPAQQGVKVPFLLSNPLAEVGGWEFLIEHDPSGGVVVGVELCDSAMGVPIGPDTVFYYAPWHDDPNLRPEYFNYQLNANGHPNWIRVVGIQNMAWPEYVTPELPQDEERLLFCLIFDVSPEWDGHNVIFNFHTKNCIDNTMTGSGGQELWGPHPESPYPPSRPDWLNCPYHDAGNDVVYLLGGPGPGVPTVERGDVNCDNVSYSVGDAMIFVGYLVYGDEGLQDDEGAYYCGSWEGHCFAADIDGDGYCLTVHDFIKLVRIINGYEPPFPDRPEDLYVAINDGVVSVNREIGAARFVFDGEGEVTGEDVEYTHRDGRTIVLSYTLEDRALNGVLFTIMGDVTLDNVEAGNFYGAPMVLSHVEIPGEPPTPTRFALSQNHPNPFNPITEITYTLPMACQVRLFIYNLLGQRVATLVDEKQAAGHKTIRWDSRSVIGGEVSSGVYFYRLQAGDFVETRKMMLLK